MATQNSINLLAGSGITLTPSGSGLTIASTGGGSPVAFQATLNGDATNTTGNGAVYIFSASNAWNVSLNSGLAFNPATSTFTVPSNGIYVLGMVVGLDGLVAANTVVISPIGGAAGTNVITPSITPTGSSSFVLSSFNMITLTASTAVTFALIATGNGADNLTIKGGGGGLATGIYAYKIG